MKNMWNISVYMKNACAYSLMPHILYIARKQRERNERATKHFHSSCIFRRLLWNFIVCVPVTLDVSNMRTENAHTKYTLKKIFYYLQNSLVIWCDSLFGRCPSTPSISAFMHSVWQDAVCACGTASLVFRATISQFVCPFSHPFSLCTRITCNSIKQKQQTNMKEYNFSFFFHPSCHWFINFYPFRKYDRKYSSENLFMNFSI